MNVNDFDLNPVLRRRAVDRLASAPAQPAAEWLAMDRDSLLGELQIQRAALQIQDEDGQAMAGTLRAETAQHQLNQSQLQLQADLLNAVGQSVLALKMDNTILYWNKYAEKLYGWTADEVVGHPIMDSLGTTTPEQDTATNSLMRAGQELTAEFTDRRKDGSTFPALASISPYYDAAGQLIGKISVTMDISGRKQMEQQLRATIAELREREAQARFANEHLQLALRTGRVTTWEVDLATGDTTLISGDSDQPGVLQPIVLKRAQIEMGVHPDDRASVAALTQQAVASDHEYSHVYRASHPDGTIHWILSSGRRVVDAGGAPVKLVGAAVDITDQKLADEKRRLHAQLLDTVGESVIAVDPTTRIIYWNQGAEKLYGWSPAEATGQRLIDLMAGIVPDESRQRLAALVAQGGRLSGTVTNHRRDGSKVPVFNTVTSIMNDAGEYAGIIAVAFDLTEQKRMEDRLNIMFQLAPDPIVLFDHQMKFRDVNKAYLEITGYTYDELIGKSSIELGITAEADPAKAAQIRDDLAHGRPIADYETYVLTRKGTRVDLEANMHPVVIGGEAMLMASMHNISQRKQTEATLRASMRALEEMNTLRARFVSVASHQFRTPLATILLTTENLTAYRDRMDAVKIEARLHKIRNEVNHMQALINDLLHLTHIESSGYQIRLGMCDLDADCRDIVEQFQLDPKLTHTLRYTSSSQPFIARIDPKLIREALINLISNAIKYSPPYTTVGIALAESGDKLELRVSDQGIGIPASEISNVFSPFQRGSNTNEVPGTGLGLSIVKNVVQLHGGEIEVASTVGQGTTFTITMPLQRRAE